MNLTDAAAAINAATAELRQSNADARLVAEERFENALRDYIDNHGRRYAYGGLVNLLSSLARICEERSTIEGDDYETAAIALDECAEKCDLKFKEAA